MKFNWSDFGAYLFITVKWSIPLLFALGILRIRVFNDGWKLWRKLLLMRKSAFPTPIKGSRFVVRGEYWHKTQGYGRVNALTISYGLKHGLVDSVTVRINKQKVYRARRLLWIFCVVEVYRGRRSLWESAIEVALLRALGMEISEEYRHVGLKMVISDEG